MSEPRLIGEILAEERERLRPDPWSKDEAIVNLTEWLVGYIEDQRDIGNNEDAAALTEELLRPALVALHPVHETVAL